MGKKQPGKNTQIKQWVATEAARIYASQSAKDLHKAKLKAAERVGVHDKQLLPSNEEIELAIQEYQRLFSSSDALKQVRLIQNKAMTAMTFFERFKPRIVGALAKGTADQYATIYIHLFSDHAEEVDWLLMENQIPHDTFNKTYYLNNQKDAVIVPAYGFVAEDTPVELSVFPEVSLRSQARCSPKGRPIERLSLNQFKQSISQHD